MAIRFLSRLVLAVFAVAALGVAPAMADPQPVSGRVRIEKVVSPGGIEAWLVQESAVPLVVLQMGVPGGSTLEPDAKAGLAQLHTSLLREGAGALSSKEFRTALEDDAIRLGFDAGRDTSFATLQTLSENVDKAFRLLSLALQVPRFDPEDIERVRKQHLAGLQQALSDPGYLAQLAFFSAAFPDHPYGRPTAGTAETLAAITRDDLVAHHAKAMTRSGLKIGVVGDIDAERLAVLLDRTFAKLPAGPETPHAAPPVTPRAGAIELVQKPNPQSVALFGLPGILREDADFIPAYVMNYILGGGGFASRLMEEVREKRGLAYGVASWLNPLDSAGLYMGQVATRNDAVGYSLNLIRREFERMAREGVTEEELRNAKTYLTGSYPLRFDSNSKIARQLVAIQLDDLGLDYINERNGLVEAVTAADVARVAKRLLDADGLLIAVAGSPEGEIDGAETWRASLAAREAETKAAE